MWITFVVAGLMADLAVGTAVSPIVLARDGQPKAKIVVPSEASPAEQTAVRELAEYLGKVTGAKLEIVAEGDAAGSDAAQAILEEVLNEVMFELPSRGDVSKCVIDRQVVKDSAVPTLVPRSDTSPRPARPRRAAS